MRLICRREFEDPVADPDDVPGLIRRNLHRMVDGLADHLTVAYRHRGVAAEMTIELPAGQSFDVRCVIVLRRGDRDG